MPSLTDLLNNAAPNFINIRAFLAHFVDNVTPLPNQSEIDRFTTLATRICENRQQQTAVLQLSRLGHSSRFPHLHRTAVTYQLIRRILDPGQFDQGEFGLCGAAAFATTVCKEDAVGFARFATQLFETGQALLRGRAIQPEEQILNFNPAATMVKEADFLVLASLRDSKDALSEAVEKSRYGGTGLEAMFDWLKTAGYPEVVMIRTPPKTDSIVGLAKTVAYAVWNTFQKEEMVINHYSKSDHHVTTSIRGLNPKNKLEVLGVACGYCTLGWKVFLLGGNQIASAAPEFESAAQLLNTDGLAALGEAKRNVASKALANSPENHWMVAEHLNVNRKELEIRVWSWAKHYETCHMPVEPFLEAFNGFVATSPVPSGLVPAIPGAFREFTTPSHRATI